MLSKGLHFCPCRHFDLFDTILDVNRFVRNLTLRKHYRTVDSTDNSNGNFLESSDDRSNLIEYTFRELCAIRDLEDLSQEGNLTDLSISKEDKVQSVKYKIISDFYPVKSCTP